MHSRFQILNFGFSKILIYILLLPSFIFSQDIRFERITRDNGLPKSTITCIEQDSKGFIWMGSFNGLIKYDGYNYKLFSHNVANIEGLPGHLVNQIICAPDGYIYLSVSNNGFSILNPKTEKFDNYRMEDSITLDRDNINGMKMDINGNLWLASDKGLHFFNTKTRTLKQYNFVNPQIIFDSTNNYHNYISAIAIDSLNNLFLLGYNSTLSYYNTKTHTSKAIYYSERPQESIFIFNSGKLELLNNKLWVSTENDGIFIYDIEKSKTIKHLLPKTIVSSIKKLNKQIWIATDGQGIYISDNNNQIINHLVNNPYDPFSISSDAIYCISQSRDQTIWLGCYSTGLNLYNKSRHKFSSISEIGDKDHKLTNRSIICLQNKNDSILIIGTDGGGINSMNLNNGKIHLIQSNNGVLNKIVAKTICNYNSNTFYIGTYGNGLYKCEWISPTKIKASQVKRQLSGKHKHVWYIHKISDTALFLGYLHSGLSIYNPENDTYIDLDAFDGHNIHTIKKIGNEFWISSEQKGITICNAKGEVIRKYVNNGTNQSSLASNYVQEIFQDSKGQIWVGTNSTGLNLMKNNKFENINRNYDFPAQMVTNIEEDNEGFLWISTDKGLIRFNPKTFVSELFDNKDGLQGKKFNINSSYNHKNTTLYFGGVDGLSFFHPKEIQRNKVLPQIVITRLLVDNKQVEVNDTINNKVILNQPIAYMSGLTLSHNENDFTIEFSALHFESSSKNQYLYKLEGFDNDWIKTKPGQPLAKYTNLLKGNFIFKVKAANADNIWTEEPFEFPIKITPPFYLTNWFYLIVALCTMVLVFLYIRYRTIKLSRDKKHLEKLINERTKELEDKAQTVSQQNQKISHINKQLSEYNKTRDRIFSIIAHDLKSPLNAIISFSNILDKEYYFHAEEERKKFISIIQQTSVQMNNLILNLLHWANSQIGNIKVDPKEILLEDVFYELQQLTEANAIEKCIQIKYQANNTQVFADYEMLVTILRNLISNGLKFTHKGGVISVISESNNKYTTISVIDTGIGMTPEQIKIIFDHQTLISNKGTENESGTGLGLFLCKDFTQRNKGEFIIEKNAPQGTVIKTKFPTYKDKTK